MKALKIIGLILLLVGIVDLIGMYVGYDMWRILNVDLPGIIWQYSTYIEVGLGMLLIHMATVFSRKASDS